MKFQQVKLWEAAKWGATPLWPLGLACTSTPADSPGQSTGRKVRPCSEGSYKISHLKWGPCLWRVSLKLRGGGMINLGTWGGNASNPHDSSLLCPPWNVTISLKRKVYLVVLIFLAITSSFPELLQFSSEYQNDNNWSFKIPPTVTM